MSKGNGKKKNQNAKKSKGRFATIEKAKPAKPKSFTKRDSGLTIKKAERYQAKNYTKVVTPSVQIKKLSVSDAKKKNAKKR
jgi:hypothetical protein